MLFSVGARGIAPPLVPGNTGHNLHRPAVTLAPAEAAATRRHHMPAPAGRLKAGARIDAASSDGANPPRRTLISQRSPTGDGAFLAAHGVRLTRHWRAAVRAAAAAAAADQGGGGRNLRRKAAAGWREQI